MGPNLPRSITQPPSTIELVKKSSAEKVRMEVV
jgi:hypothetical protein